ncbi:MAG: protoheme IX farnesyltransferase [Clostridia bacterium]|nr:protoheme IX farnesyltransferase [Clostridia bacterium]
MGSLPQAAVAPVSQVRQAVRDYVALTKPGIVLLMLVATVTTMWAATDGRLSPWLLVATLVGTALAAGAANTLNCYIDRDIDAIMRRTRNRPLPAGRLRPEQALRFGVALAVLSFAVLATWVNVLAAVIALSGAAFYVFIYTLWLKRSTPQNIVIGGAAGAVPPLIGWAAVTNHVSLPAILLFLVIFLWTPPHFWALALYKNEDYRRARVPMMPVVRGERATKIQMLVYTVLLVLCTLTLYPMGVAGPVYAVAAAVMGLVYIALAARALRDSSDAMAKRLFGFSNLYLGLLFVFLAFG